MVNDVPQICETCNKPFIGARGIGYTHNCFSCWKKADRERPVCPSCGAWCAAQSREAVLDFRNNHECKKEDRV